jgi:hypothetical protein
MSAKGFRSVGWVAGVGAAALGCYMLSLQVASERAELSGIETRIVRTQQAIRDLQTELGTRGRLSQLEHWNAEVLALSSPVARQFVENEVLLARLETPSGQLGGAPLRMASAETGEMVAPAAPPQPQVRTAAAAAPAAPAAAPQPQARTAAAVAPAAAPARPLVRQASLPAPPAEGPERPAAARTIAEVRPAAARAAPARAAALLDERTARHIGETARAEARERRPTDGASSATAADKD